MRIAGWLVSSILSMAAYTICIGCYTPVGKMFEGEACMLPFGTMFIHLLIGLIVFGGGSVLIGFLWAFVWKPFE